MKIIDKCVHGNVKISECKQCKKLYSVRRKSNTSRYLWEAAKARARVRGIPFTIAVEDIDIPAVCPVLGVPLDLRSRDYVPSIDEIVQGLGYVPGNVCVISGRANRIKSDASLKELEALVAYIKIQSDPRFGKWPEQL